MSAFPMILEKAPRARLIVAGANHHTKAGYWESIRAAQPPHLPIEFRGYVPEEEIPELYRTTSAVVMPYDSATGSSGPAHQACEYGVPIVCADIPDFREMAVEENMAILFHKVGDSADLARQLTTILGSPQLEREMAERNFAAGVEMTLGNVVARYLRWFELQRCKKHLSSRPSLSTDDAYLSNRSSAATLTAWAASTPVFIHPEDGEHQSAFPAARLANIGTTPDENS